MEKETKGLGESVKSVLPFYTLHRHHLKALYSSTYSIMAAATQKDLQERMQTVALQLQKIEDELQSTVEVRQRLDSQLTENEQVKKVS